MNKILSSLIVLGLCSLILVSCNSNTPKGVADRWLNSFYHMDYKEAKKYSTQETQDNLSMLENFATMVADSQKQNAQKIKIDIKDVKEEGDNATVNYTISEDKATKSISLKKIDGKWLVHYSKQDKDDESIDDVNMADETMNEEEASADAALATDSTSADAANK